MLPPCGTFDYVVIVPADVRDGTFKAQATLREPILATGDELHDNRPVGHMPRVSVDDAGLTPDASASRPWVLRSRITLTADGDSYALLPELAFHVDKGLMTRLLAGDTIHLVGTACGGLALSIVRADELIAAVGAITHVPLGRNVQARVPFDVISRSEDIVRERDPGFEFPELPIEISVNGARTVLFSGYRTLREYAIFAQHGFFTGEPGTDVCASICRKGACSPQAAQASAMLLDRSDSK